MLNCLYTLLLSLLLLPWSPTVLGKQSPHHEHLRTAMDRGDYTTAEQILRSIKSAAPESFVRNNYDYLLARLLEWRRDYVQALALFQQVTARNSPLASYALWHQAEITRSTGDLKEEQRLLQRFISQNRNHLFYERALRRLSESYLKTGQFQAAINTLKMLGASRRDTMAVIGEAQLALGQNEPARLSFETVLSNGSMDDASLRSIRGLDRMKGSSGAAPTEAERLRRARIYQFNRHFEEARQHWLALIKDFPKSDKRSEALFQIGRGYFLEENFQDSIKWYDRAHDEFPSTDDGEQGFYFVGHCYQTLNDTDRAIERYQEFIKAYPDSKYVGYAHLNAIDTLRSAGRQEEALKWATRAQTRTTEPFIATTALFAQAKIRLAQQNYSAALAAFTTLKSRNPNVRGLTAATNSPEVSYMRGYCLEKLGRYEDAIIEYLSLPEVRNGASAYYGRAASERLRAMQANVSAKNLVLTLLNQAVADAKAARAQGDYARAKKAANQALRFSIAPSTREEMLKVLREAYSKLRGYQIQSMPVTISERTAPLGAGSQPATSAASGFENNHRILAQELLFLRLYDEGASELAETQPNKPTFAFYCARGNCADRTVDYSESILNSLPEDYRLELLPRDLAEMFYPYPYRLALSHHAIPRNLDPRFVLSIVRQESRYNPRTKSSAAARGMMQFIPSTADRIAAQLNLRDFEQSDLYNPDIAILFGSQYLKNLFDEFNSPEAAAAAYNGSEDSVRRWRGRAQSSEIERFVIEILKSQTKDYVFKVLNYYAAYRELYPDDQIFGKQ